jgi:hypothetical protein
VLSDFVPEMENNAAKELSIGWLNITNRVDFWYDNCMQVHGYIDNWTYVPRWKRD